VSDATRARDALAIFQKSFGAIALLLAALLPVIELFARGLFDSGIPGSTGYVQNLTLWIAFLGAMAASRENAHLSLATAEMLPEAWRRPVRIFTSAISAGVAAALAKASLDFVRAEMESPASIAGWLPQWVVESILPFAFAVISLRFVQRAGGGSERAIALAGLAALGVLLWFVPAESSFVRWGGIALLLVALPLGAPIFVVLGGAAVVLFYAEGVPIASIPVETYRSVVSPSIPTLPLFTLTGFLLAEGGASDRLVRLFRALFGWLPGGLAIAATLVCAFFTSFTGASGVTILALGGILMPVLVRSGYREGFSLGLITATGSIGLLFPPSLPVILYAVVAHVPIPDLFRAAFLPGLLLVAAVVVMGMRESLTSHAERPAFSAREAGAALWASKWELLLPVIMLVGMFGGFCTLVEAAALTAVYALFVEVVIHRELSITRDVPRVLMRCLVMIGSVLVILGVAMGLTNYLVDAEIPMRAAAWVEATVHSRVLFLLALNVFLLIVGCLMDIFSAIVVVVPLILPISQVFGIDPLHLGVIFLANLELGYLTPPVGLNLFLASSRFDKPLWEVCVQTLPFLLALLGVVLLVTYVPWFTLGAVAIP
jgi:tripartite ATP-independent transporter DctM subunit